MLLSLCSAIQVARKQHASRDKTNQVSLIFVHSVSSSHQAQMAASASVVYVVLGLRNLVSSPLEVGSLTVILCGRRRMTCPLVLSWQSLTPFVDGSGGAARFPFRASPSFLGGSVYASCYPGGHSSPHVYFQLPAVHRASGAASTYASGNTSSRLLTEAD